MVIETILTGILSFAATNMDDIVIDTILFAQSEKKKDTCAIVLGKYIGIGLLVLVSLLGAYFLKTVPRMYIRLLGLIPIYLGVKQGWEKHKHDENEELADTEQQVHGLAVSVALITIANGADNIGVYIPLFASFSTGQMIILCAVFAFMIALWCILAKRISNLPILNQFLIRYKHVLVPVVFVLLGVYILMQK